MAALNVTDATVEIMSGKMKTTPYRIHRIKATYGGKLNLPTVVEQRSKSLAQFHTSLQEPGFAPQQVKHFNPYTAGKGEC